MCPAMLIIVWSLACPSDNSVIAWCRRSWNRRPCSGLFTLEVSALHSSLVHVWPAELSPRTFCTFAREFSPFTARGCSWATSDSRDGFGRVVERPHDPFPPSPQKRTGPRALRSCVPSAVGGHAAVSRDGHVRQAADRLAPARARRAVSAPAVRSAGTASPVPKYISSGVCPRNAECGSTRLCSST